MKRTKKKSLDKKKGVQRPFLLKKEKHKKLIKIINIKKRKNFYKIYLLLFLFLSIFLLTIFILKANIIKKNILYKSSNFKSYLNLNSSSKEATYKKSIGVISLFNDHNVGNILVKFSIFKKLKELGFNPTIICSKGNPNINVSFLNRTVNFKVINESYSELNENEYDYLIVNSDQTWAYFSKIYFYDIAFLKFAENWKVPKFTYAASSGREFWFYNREEEELAKRYLKNFTGISFREKGMIKLVKDHLNITAELVIDPTLLIDKNYYLDEIKDYKNDFNINEKYIFVYQLDKSAVFEKFIKDSSEKLNYKVYKLNLTKGDFIESFIYGMNNSQAVITDSYHGTVLSINFNKPFISFINKERGRGRFYSLKEVFHLENRFVEAYTSSSHNINLLLEPLNLNQTLFNEFKASSINFLKRQLGII